MFTEYLEYIKNTGGSPKIEHFDDDFDPIGPIVRSDLMKAGLVFEKDGRIYLIENDGGDF